MRKEWPHGARISARAASGMTSVGAAHSDVFPHLMRDPGWRVEVVMSAASWVPDLRLRCARDDIGGCWEKEDDDRVFITVR